MQRTSTAVAFSLLSPGCCRFPSQAAFLARSACLGRTAGLTAVATVLVQFSKGRLDNRGLLGMMVCAILLLKRYTRSLTAVVVCCCCCLPKPRVLSETFAAREL